MNESMLSKAAYTQQLQSQGKVGKKPYSSPRLIDYGDLVEITGSGSGPVVDGAGTKRGV